MNPIGFSVCGLDYEKMLWVIVTAMNCWLCQRRVLQTSQSDKTRSKGSTELSFVRIHGATIDNFANAYSDSFTFAEDTCSKQPYILVENRNILQRSWFKRWQEKCQILKTAVFKKIFYALLTSCLHLNKRSVLPRGKYILKHILISGIHPRAALSPINPPI